MDVELEGETVVKLAGFRLSASQSRKSERALVIWAHAYTDRLDYLQLHDQQLGLCTQRGNVGRH